jgi:pyrroline-5-carboxylate reductase
MPLTNKRIGIIGAGAMGSALCRGLVSAGAAQPEALVVSDPHADHVRALVEGLGVRGTDSNADAARDSDIVVLAVKPHTVHTALADIRSLRG